MAAGTDVTGFIAFSNYALAPDVGIVALALILFEGGLASGWQPIRAVLRPALGLATVGTVVTALATGAGAAALLRLELLEGLLLGAILACTDGAAVFSILRGSTLRQRLAHTLEGEAGMNDPVAVLLVLGFVAWIQGPDYGATDMLRAFVVQVGVGAVIGVTVGRVAAWALRTVSLATAGRYPVASIAAAVTAFGAGQALHGSGFLAVYLTGLAMGSTNSPAARTCPGSLGFFNVVFFAVLVSTVLQGTTFEWVAAGSGSPRTRRLSQWSSRTRRACADWAPRSWSSACGRATPRKGCASVSSTSRGRRCCI